MSRERAEQLKSMKSDLVQKFDGALAALDQRIEQEESGAAASKASEQKERREGYRKVGEAAKTLAEKTGSTAAGLMALRQFPGRSRKKGVTLSFFRTPEH